MVRKETYATTGPRMLVRFFGGWDFDAADASSRLPADAGYDQGRADGRQTCSATRRRPPPSFLVAALKDSLSGNLDRIQIVKVWLDGTASAGEGLRRGVVG